MKILNLDKNGYKAIHLYISIDNSCLPWELQIWRKLDYKKNEDAHFKKYGRY